MGTCLQDTWTKQKGWEVGMAGVGGSDGGKWRQLYLNNNFKKREKKEVQIGRYRIDRGLLRKA